MKTAGHRDVGAATGRMTGQGQRVLVGFGPAVAQEHAGHAVRPHPQQFAAKSLATFEIDGVGIKHQLLRLLGQRLHQPRVTVPDTRHGVTAVEIEVLAPGGVGDGRAAAGNQIERQMGIDGQFGGSAQHGYAPGCIIPAVSSKPSIRFIF